MVDIITQGGTKIYKFNAKDRKDLKLTNKCNYAVQQGSNLKCMRTLSQVNRALGLSQRVGFKPSSFKKK